MSRFGLYGKVVARPGQRDALAAVLLEAAAALAADPECELYVVNAAPAEPDALWVTEVWRSQEAHAASLTRPAIQAIVARGRPLIAGGERVDLLPLGGKGLDGAGDRGSGIGRR